MALKIPRDNKVVKTLRLPSEMAEKLSKIAQTKELSFNRVVEICLEYALDNYEEDKEEEFNPQISLDDLYPEHKEKTKKKSNSTKKDELK